MPSTGLGRGNPTSNIVSNFAPIDALIRFDVALGLFDPPFESRAIQKREVIRDEQEPIDREAVNRFF